MIGHLEHCRRAPSAVLAEAIIDAYQLDSGEAAMFRAEAVEGVGPDSPFRRTQQRGGPSSMRAGSSGAFYGAWQPSRSSAW